MPEFGSYAILLAFVLSVYALLSGSIALYQLASGTRGRIEPNRLLETSRRAGIASFVACTSAAFALVWAAFTNDYSVSYILHHSNNALPVAYKFAALWSGQEGSLLLWAWILTGYGFALRIRHAEDHRLAAHASTIMAGIQVFFFALLCFSAPPFALEANPPADGFGLNPLLQYPEMVIHPPLLYLGYVGFAVPFSFALGALIMRYPGDRWIRITRNWTMVTWLFLTCGIFLGAHWAYSVLGWGGYWGWDPVENASLMPWLTGTAFLHSVTMQEKRGMMKVWNVWMIFTTFLLCILGTLLTRSGVISSVHAFAQSSIGTWFTTFLVILLCTCLFVFFRQRGHLQAENKLESLVSRESSFLFNNLVLLVACFAVLWGTLFPVLSEFVTGSKVTVGAPFYNRVNLPMGLLLLFLTGVGPLLAWRSNSLKAVRRNFILPGVVALATALILILAGIRPWSAGDDATTQTYSVIALSLAAGVITAIATEFLRGASVLHRQSGRNIFSSLVLLTRRNTRRYGGYIVHFGIVVIFIGIAGGAFNQTAEKELGFGDSINIGGYSLVCQSFSQDSNPNYQTEYALLDVYHHGRKITQLAPERRVYLASQQPATIVANHSTLARDLYVIYEGRNEDTDRPIIKVFLNPLIAWIWIGVLIVVAGTFVAMLPSLTPAAAKLASDKPVAAPLPPVSGGDA